MPILSKIVDVEDMFENKALKEPLRIRLEQQSSYRAYHGDKSVGLKLAWMAFEHGMIMKEEYEEEVKRLSRK